MNSAEIAGAVNKHPGDDACSHILKQVLETGRALGLEVGELADYFPHRFQYGVFKGDKRQKAIESLMKHGKADSKEQAGVILNTLENINRGRKVPNLEMAREYNIPGYEKTKQALGEYLADAAERFAPVSLWGKDWKKSEELFQRMADEGYHTGSAHAEFEIATRQKEWGSAVTKISEVVRGYNVTTKMGLSSLTYLGQPTNTATIVGFLRTSKAIPKALTPEGRRFALPAVLTVDSATAISSGDSRIFMTGALMVSVWS